MKFQELVKEELLRAKRFNPPINSLHEGYAVILEELDELWEEVKKKKRLRNMRCIKEELVQIGAMAQRTYEDVIEIYGDNKDG